MYDPLIVHQGRICCIHRLNAPRKSDRRSSRCWIQTDYQKKVACYEGIGPYNCPIVLLPDLWDNCDRSRCMSDRAQKTFFVKENTRCLNLWGNLWVCRGLAGEAEMIAA